MKRLKTGKGNADRRGGYGCRAVLTVALLLAATLVGVAPSGARAAGLTVVLQDGIRADGATAAHYDAGLVDPLITPRMAGRFTLRNAGPGPLIIRRLTTSCGCTSALVDEGKAPLPRTLAPGARVEVAVTVDLAHHRGQVAKTASIYTDAGPSPALVLEVRGQVQSQLSMTPTHLDFGQVSLGSARTLPLTLTVDARAGLKAAPALVSMNPALQIALDPAAKARPGVFAYRVTLAGRGARGRFTGVVMLAPTGGFAADAASAVVPVTGDLVGGVAATPGAVVFGSVIAGKEAVRQVYLSSADLQSLDSLTLSCPSRWVTVRLHPSGPADSSTDTVLDIRVSDQAPPGVLSAQVAVVTGKGERLLLPVSAIVVRAVGAAAQARAVP